MKPREWWVWPEHDAIKPVGQHLALTPSSRTDPVLVREVMPDEPDWKKLAEELAEALKMSRMVNIERHQGDCPCMTCEALTNYRKATGDK